MFEFVNDNDYDCGQAAACTLLAHYGMIPAYQHVMGDIEEEYPPNIMGGYLGTSAGQIRKILESKFVIEEINGPMELVSTLKRGTPVVVTFQVSSFAGHWSVATGITGKFIHLTNHGDMPLEEFFTKWNGWLPKLIGFNQRGFIHAGH